MMQNDIWISLELHFPLSKQFTVGNSLLFFGLVGPYITSDVFVSISFLRNIV